MAPLSPTLDDLIAAQQWPQVAALCERALEAEPEAKAYAWHLGLALLMMDQEDEAQMVWMMAMAAGEENDIDRWTKDLLLILDAEADRQQRGEDWVHAWAIRQYMRELDPANLNNLLLLLSLSVQANLFESQQLVGWSVIPLLEQASATALSLRMLTQALIDILSRYPVDAPIEALVTACVPYFHDSSLAQTFIARANYLAYHDRRPDMAAQLLTQAQRLIPDHLPLLQQLSCFDQNIGQHEKAIAGAQRCCDLAEQPIDQIASYHVLLRALMSVGSRWDEIERTFRHLLSLIESLLASAAAGELPEAPPTVIQWLYTVPFFQPYLRDALAENRRIQNQTVAIAQACTRRQHADHIARYQFSAATALPKLKVGYVSSCLRRHSVGWLARWLYQHHDRERVQIHSYMVSYNDARADRLRDWYVEQSDVVHKLDAHGANIADRIYDDDIQILVDLDSLTLYTTCEVMALKPAPVQVSWLGWDASGIPAIDYYIADPYVLPEGAEAHYAETLWRLPQTYIAVDGFELNPPSLRRSDLGIPEDAVVYLSAQRGYKRHPHTIKLQLQIIREVPGSYFIIKAMTLDESLKAMFVALAEAEGVSRDRLRFLTGVPEEATHRANLALADVVLDTYPYNGATTTLETLWMGIPLVTRVGETFSSRNSYTMMRNAGISEGIAWSAEEYVDWGVRLGKDADLRRQVSWRLRQGRRSAPLWNAPQFVRHMERAYRQMWERHIGGTAKF